MAEETNQDLTEELTKALQGVEVDAAPGEPPPEKAQPAEEQAGQATAESTTPPPADEQQAQAGDSTPPAAPALLEQLKAHGVDLEADDDAAAVKAIAEQIAAGRQAAQHNEQLSQLATYGQQYLENAGEFQQFLAQREKLASQQQAERPAYLPPEMQPHWWNQVQRNEQTGQLEPINGGTPETVQKVARYLEWKQRFDSNPFEHLQPFIEERAQQIAKKQFEEAMPGFEQKVAAQQFLVANRDWLFEGGAVGGKLSEEGEAFAGYLREAAGDGFNPQQQQNYAMRRLSERREQQKLKTELDELKAKLSGGGEDKEAGGQEGQQAAQKTPEQQKEEFLKDAAAHGPSHAGSTHGPPAAAAKDQPLQDENATLQEMLTVDMKNAGFQPHEHLADAL